MANSVSSEEPAGRGQWANQMEFILSLIGFSVGLGNIWRFPYLCMENGGGAFLIPYFIFLFICGMPLFFMELSIGQFSGLSPVGVFNICSIFKGIGWGMLTISGIFCIYYNIIITWVIYYLGMSFNWELPWKHCNNTWNTPTCYSFSELRENNMTLYRLNDESTSFNASSLANLTEATSRSRSSAEEFWLYNVLEVSDGIGNINGINYNLLIALISAWILVYVCLVRGIKSSGKVVYVTATAPYIFLTILLVRGVTLPGSSIGIYYYVTPRWELLFSFKIWATAAMQIFYSLGPAWGGLITMASYNKFNNNMLRDSVLIPIICCFTSFYGGFAIFSVTGHMAYVSGQTDIKKVIQSGPGLAFVAYPEALAQLPGGAIWSVLFFVMLITLGLDSQFVTFETITSSLMDQYPRIAKRKHLFTLLCVLVQFGIGLPLVTRAGIYIFQILDWYASAFAATVFGLLECVAVAYFYGIRRFYSDIECMLSSLHIVWKFWWGITLCLLTPLSLLIVIITTIIQYDEPVFDGNYHYPRWAVSMGWLIAMLSIFPILVVAIVEVVKARKNLPQLFRTNATWDKSTAMRIQAADSLLEKEHHAYTSIPLELQEGKTLT